MMTYDEALYIAAEHLCIAIRLKRDKNNLLTSNRLDPSDARLKLQNIIEGIHEAKF